LGAAAVVAAAVGLAPDPPQVSLLASAKTQDRVLKDIDAAVYAPAQYEAYAEAVRRAQSELSAQREKFYYSRQYLTFDRLCQGALQAGGMAERVTRESRMDFQRRTMDSRQQTSDLIASVRSRINRIGLSNPNRGSLVRAEVLLREAEILGSQNDWFEAHDRVATALSLARTAEMEVQQRSGRLTNDDLLRVWDNWVHETIHVSSRAGSKAILVVKTRSTCLLIESGRIVRSYTADLGKNGVFDKSYRGDHATPEGKYKIVKKKGAGQSKYYKALLLNYPNEQDIRDFRRARARGLIIPRSRLGGLIEIHGDGGKDKNWTEGCVALDNHDMDDLYSRVDVGTPVTIVGNYSAYDRTFR